MLAQTGETSLATRLGVAAIAVLIGVFLIATGIAAIGFGVVFAVLGPVLA